MAARTMIRLLNPWGARREQREQRLSALRQRDGDNCTRCRRPIQFDLPAGHDLAARVEAVRQVTAGGGDRLENLCLTHGRCNAGTRDDTLAVRERLRLKSEAALVAKPRRKRKAA